MTIDTREIRECCQALDTERKFLADLIAERAMLDMTGHQNQISVAFNYGKQSVSLPVTELSQSYRSKIIRGREMIALGAKLAFNGMIERQRQRVLDIEKRLFELSMKGGAA